VLKAASPVANALLDRLLTAVHRLELKGESLRKRQKETGKSLTLSARTEEKHSLASCANGAHDAKVRGYNDYYGVAITPAWTSSSITCDGYISGGLISAVSGAAIPAPFTMN